MTRPVPVTRNPRVLILGQDRDVLETVCQEAVDYGLSVRGSVDAETALEQFDGREFDIIAFGGGLPDALTGRLERDFRHQNPRVKFLRTPAPRAGWIIAQAAEGKDEAPAVDLDAYCARIGYNGPLTPTVETLRALHELHPASIPFEAIDVLLDRGIDISPDAVDSKLIGRRRGGYCYEHNSLFKRVLTAIGFRVEGLVATVRWMTPPGSAPAPRSHMVLRVTIDGVPWLADVGFGVCVPTSPLRMDVRDAQPTRHESFRVIPFGAGPLVQALVNGEWLSAYDISPEPLMDGHYEPLNWFTSTHPSSHFRERLIVTRVTAQARYSLLQGRLTVRTAGGETERSFLSADEIEQTLSDIFTLRVEPEWRPVIVRAAAAVALERLDVESGLAQSASSALPEDEVSAAAAR